MKKNPARNSCRVPAKLLGAGAGISRNFLLSFYSCNSWQEILDFPVSCKIKEIPYSRNLQLSSHVGGRICESALRESQSGWAHPAGWWDRLFLDFWYLAPARGSLARADFGLIPGAKQGFKRQRLARTSPKGSKNPNQKIQNLAYTKTVHR